MSGDPLGAQLGRLGHALGAREAEHREALEAARACAEKLHSRIGDALAHYHQALEAEGAAHLRVELGAVRTDDKHVRSVEFDLVRGRTKAIVTAKSRGDVTLVGPFRIGKDEGPCRKFAFDAEAEIEAALGDFLTRFLEEAATP